MESFAEQMLNEIDKRCKEYQLSHSLRVENEEFDSNKKRKKIDDEDMKKEENATQQQINFLLKVCSMCIVYQY